MRSRVSRRTVLKLAAVAPCASWLAPAAADAPDVRPYIDADGMQRGYAPLPFGAMQPRMRRVGISSRHFQWTETLEDVVELAKRAKFDAIAWRVQPGAHIEPQHAARDLPKAVELTKRAGLRVDLVETSIDRDADHADAVFETLAALEIPLCQLAGLRYDYGRALAPQIEANQQRLLATMRRAAEHGIVACYQNLSTQGDFGAALVDLWLALREGGPATGVIYDCAHATVRSGRTGWIDGAALLQSQIRALSIRDFVWKLGDPLVPTGPVWVPTWRPLGEGMVDIVSMLRWFGGTSFDGPINLQFDYHGLSGAPLGAMRLDLTRAQFVRTIARDLDYLRAVMRELHFAT